MILRTVAYYSLVAFFLCTPLFSQRSLSRANVGVEYGIWKPSSLDKNTAQPLKNVDGAGPYFGLAFTTPIFKSHSLRFSLMQWRQEQLQEVDLASVTLRHISVDLKYIILPEYTISPYASYGVAAIWSREEPMHVEDARIPLDRAGLGFNLGAGIDFLLHQHVGVGVEYQYIYAVFSKRVGLTSNYSGPKFSAKFYYIF